MQTTQRWYFEDLRSGETRRKMLRDDLGVTWFTSLGEGKITCLTCRQTCTDEPHGDCSTGLFGWTYVEEDDGFLNVTMCWKCVEGFETFKAAAEHAAAIADAMVRATEATQH